MPEIVRKTCANCGNEFVRPKDYSHKQWAERSFCSVKCGSKTKARHTDPHSRFNENYIPEPMSGCWLWTGTEMSDGYGHIRINGKLWRAHRLSFHLNKRPIVARDYILHQCDNRLCVNPDHLYLGTHQSNMKDMVARGRSLRGEKHSQAKLTAHDVCAIRDTSGSLTEIGQKYGVSRVAIKNIKSRKSWSHIP